MMGRSIIWPLSATAAPLANPLSPDDLFRRRAETLVDFGNLLGVDAEFAAEAEAAGALSGGAQLLRIVDFRVDPICRRCDFGKPGRQHQLGAEIEQLVGVSLDAQVELEIDGAEYEPVNGARTPRRSLS